MKKLILVQIVAVLILFTAGQICRLNFPDAGITSLRTQEDTLQLDAGISYIIGRDMYNSFVEYPEQFDYMKDEADIIVIGEPTGKLYQEGDFFGQEVRIKKIIEGGKRLKDDDLTDRLYALSFGGAFGLFENKVVYFGCNGLMQRSSDYLIFMESRVSNQLPPGRGYGLLGGIMGYVKLDSDGDRATPVSGIGQRLRYNDVWKMEYIADSQVTLDQIYIMKERILLSFRDKLAMTDSKEAV